MMMMMMMIAAIICFSVNESYQFKQVGKKNRYFSYLINNSNEFSDAAVCKITRDWVVKWVVDFGLCPWAARSSSEEKMKVVVVNDHYTQNVEQICKKIIEEANLIPKEKYDTILIVLPNLIDFLEFLEVHAAAEYFFIKKKLNNNVQLATFHPNFVFEGNDEHSVENYTNRSPFPMIHLLKVSEVSRAIADCNGDTDFVWERNIRQLRTLGLKKVQKIQSNIRNS
jgi:hypothetical protein